MPPPKTYHSQQYDTATRNRSIDRNLRRGGNFITQAYPTNFHEFATRKILTSGDSIDNYREVSTAQKATIEAADSNWEKPGDWLVEQAEANGAVYNTATGYFELNGLVDITTEQMSEILSWKPLSQSVLRDRDFAFCESKCRTFLPIVSRGTGINGSLYMGFHLSTAEVLAFRSSCFYDQVGLFRTCRRLHSILNFNFRDVATEKYQLDKYFLQECGALVNFKASRLDRSLWIADSPLLSMESLEHLINNRGANHFNDQLTITLHPEAYARVTDEIFAAAAEKNITIATTA